MMKILVPVDLSSCSINALKYALDFGKRFNAKITILHALTYPKTEEKNIVADISSFKKGIKQVVDELVYYDNILSEIICKEGELLDLIKQENQDKTFDLIVLGLHGKHNLKEFLLGSHASDIIEHSPCPVMVVPPKVKFNQLDKAIYATDYENTDAQSLQSFIDLVGPLNPEITMLHVITREEKEKGLEPFKKSIQKNITYSNLLFHEMAHLTVWDGINAHAQWESMDLVILSNKRRKLLDKELDYSTSKDVAFYSKIPVLTFHHQ